MVKNRMAMDTDVFSDIQEFVMEAKSEGKKILAFMAHEFIPVELIHAAGLIPLKILFNGSDELSTAGNEYMTPSCCSWANSVLGMFESESESRYSRILNKIDYYICSNYCNADLFASEQIAKMIDKPSMIFFTPFKNSGKHVDGFYYELLKFKAKLEEISGTEISNEKIWASIKLYNTLRYRLLEINSSDMPAKEKITHIWKAAVLGPFYKDLPQLDSKDFMKPVGSTGKPKVVFSGCQPYIGDDVVDLIEDCGLTISLFDTWDGSHFSSSLVDPEMEKDGVDPLKVLAELFKKNKASPHIIEGSEKHLELRLINHVIDTGSDGVIYYMIKFCEVYGNRRNHIKNVLRDNSIPFLGLERDFSSSIGQLRTRIEAFAEVLKDAKK